MALKIVYKICCGIDVHKTFVVACIASTNDKGVTSYESHRFSTYTSGLKTLLQWLLDRNCKDVCMESTGKYWIPVYNILEQDCSIVLAHPKYVKAIRGKKTDKKDTKWIADLFKHDLVAGSFMPPADIRQLRDLMRYRFKLTCFKSSEKNLGSPFFKVHFEYMNPSHQTKCQILSHTRELIQFHILLISILPIKCQSICKTFFHQAIKLRASSC